jgi:hypothetical protein
MITLPRIVSAVAVLVLVLGCTQPATADLMLSFDQANYTINGVGDTTSVEVFVSQVAGGPQVGSGNELVSAGIELSFPTAGSAVVASSAAVTAGPAWDNSSVIISTGGPNTLVDLGLTSLAGIADLSSPLLLGTFTFTGQSIGKTTTTVSTLGPGASFITVQGDVLDPANTPSAGINVVPARVVPEPGSLMLLGVGGLAIGFARLVRSRRDERSETRRGAREL